MKGKKKRMIEHPIFCWFGHERQGEKKFKLLSSIYGVSSVGIRQAKNESSSTRRGRNPMKFDRVTRFRETNSMVKSVSSSKI